MSQNGLVFALTSLESENLPEGLGAQLAEPTLVISAVMVVGEPGEGVVVGGGGGAGLLDDELDDELDDVRVLDKDVEVVDLSKVVVPKGGLFVTAFGTGTLRT